MKKGQKFICIESHKDFFKEGDIYEMIYLDNEKPVVQVCLKKDNLDKLIDLDTLKSKFIPYDKRKK